ncbi:hypothetical protein [Nonlabens ulvanivorans]|uniref:hypothetical protein n=1 Tax=Nonlabens ulvanivorans TaxID=906888 RepID=UPI002942CBCE|nr:hypothetical protein [Nonlabens ulvanivorans]WOI22391.1 hypothetical protein R1T42_12035 [Nonlabens ulvanivorans]
MKKRFINRFIRLTILVALFVMLFQLFSSIFTPKRIDLPWNSTARIKGFYEIENNSLDVVFLGSSHAFCTFNPAVFYKENGIRSYVFGSEEQPLWLSYHYFKEVLKHQKPKVVVLEAFFISESKEFKRDGVNKLALDDIPLSYNKYESQQVAFEDNLEGLNPLYNYHDRWKDLSEADFEEPQVGELKGYTPLYKVTPKEIKFFEYEKKNLPGKSRLYLDKIIQLAKDNDIELVLAYAPYTINKLHNQHINQLAKIASNDDVAFINYVDSTLLKEINFNSAKDFENGHTNVHGATKVSTHLSNYLSLKYQFPVHTNLEDYERLTFKYYGKDSLKEINNFQDYINFLSKLDVYVAVTAMDAIDKEALKPFEILGSIINFKDKYRTSYIGLFNKHRSFVEESIDSLPLSILSYPENHLTIKMESASFKKGNHSRIYVNQKNHLDGKSKRGFNIIVIDPTSKEVLDVASFDTMKKDIKKWTRY